MIDINNIDQIIKDEKEILRSKSKDYKENFSKIEKFIESEILQIESLKKNKQNIIPVINFRDLSSNSSDFKNEINKRGCVIIKDVFDDSLIHQMNKDLESYIEENNYYEDQKKKSNIDQYFSDLQSGKPQIFGLYWSKTQVNIRQSNELDLVKKWLNSLWTHEHNGETIFDPNNELVYADRVRRREPGDKTLGL